MELHRLTLRQINENPTLMSDEVFVPVEEVDELVGDLQHARTVLGDFAGSQVWQQAYNAVAHILWLQNELRISQYNERAALDVIAQNNRHLNGGNRDGYEARQASGVEGEKQERAEGSGVKGT